MMLFVYHSVAFFLGFLVSRRIFRLNGLWSLVAGVTFGLLLSVPSTYLIAVLLQGTGDPIGSSVAIYCFTGILVLGYFVYAFPRKRLHLFLHNFLYLSNRSGVTVVDAGVFIFSLLFSAYLMTKTFKVNEAGTLFVARNVIFDFGHALSIIRSMSWGTNIPYTSPFVSGTEHLYHFLFQFWVAIMEHFGVRIDLAFNGASTLGFVLFLATLYCVATEWTGRRLVGVLTIILTVFHGGLMFIPFFRTYGISLNALWRNPNYLFAAPFDSSLFSLFFTLNVFVNQRQLGFALAVFFTVYIVFLHDLDKKMLSRRHLVLFGLLVGSFVLWHIVLSVGLLFVMLCSLVLRRKWSDSLLLLVSTLLISLPFVIPWIEPVIRGFLVLLSGGSSHASVAVSEGPKGGIFWFAEFVIANFGLSLPFFLYGVKQQRLTAKAVIPILLLFGGFSLLSIPTGILDQKYLNVFLVLFAFFTAVGLSGALEKGIVLKAIVIVLFPVLILSGIIDFMVLKNDYLFAVDDHGKNTLITWIRKSTPPSSVFLSYQDIFDPVTLAGRKNYYGFYQEPNIFLLSEDQGRETRVQDIYTASSAATLKERIQAVPVSYVIIPRWQKEDFHYDVREVVFRTSFPVVYEDGNHLIFAVKKNE